MSDLRTSYRYWHGRGASTRDALTIARGDVANGLDRYPSDVKPWSAGQDHDLPKSRFVLYTAGARWQDMGKVIDHRGWYVDESAEGVTFGGDLYRGVVLQIPGRGGEPIFFPGYEMVDGSRYRRMQDGALIDFAWRCTELDEARRAADETARVAAEEAREYSAASDARRQFDEAAQEISDERRVILIALKERRSLPAVVAPTLCAMIRRAVRVGLGNIRSLRTKRAKLALAFDHQQGWKDA